MLNYVKRTKLSLNLRRPTMIKIGDKIPDAPLSCMQDNVPTPISSSEFFANKKVVLFALPGAFTPTCSRQHLPGFISLNGEIKAKGIDVIACLSVNDPFVMHAWGEQQGADNKVVMLADGSAKFTTAIGMQTDLTDKGFGIRSQRYAMLADNAIVKQLWLENPGKFETSAAEHVLKNI